MHQETESVRARLRAMTPAERVRLARETEADMRFPHHPESTDLDGKQEAGEVGGFLVSGPEGDHLPTTRNGELDHRLMGAAWAALHEGYRGNQYAGPDKAAALQQLIRLYRRANLQLPGNSAPPRPER